MKKPGFYTKLFFDIQFFFFFFFLSEQNILFEQIQNEFSVSRITTAIFLHKMPKNIIFLKWLEINERERKILCIRPAILSEQMSFNNILSLN